MTDREPIVERGRPAGEMPTADPTSASIGRADHASHDLTVLAAFSDAAAASSDRSAAEQLVAACPACASIAADLASLVTALHDLPPTLPAPRDFRITAEQAARLSRGGALRRLLRPFGAGGISGLRPLGAALTTLGLAGVLLSVSPLAPGVVAPRSGSTGFDSGAGAAGSPSTVLGPTASSPKEIAPVSGGDTQSGGAGQQDDGSHAPPPAPGASAATSAASGGTSIAVPESSTAPAFAGPIGGASGTGPSLPMLTWLSLVVALTGLSILGLRFAARRFA